MTFTGHTAEHPTRAPLRRWRRLTLVVATVALAVFTVDLVSSLRAADPLPVLHNLGGDFQLSSSRGGELSLNDLRGEIVLLTFGYTSCPEVCPTVLARLRALMLDLEPLGIAPQPLFVTLDPDRDDLATLGAYVEHFHPGLVGLRGSGAQTDDALRKYRVFRQREPLDSGLDYGFVHSVEIYLIDRRGRVRATFGGSVPLPDMVQTVKRLATSRKEPPV